MDEGKFRVLMDPNISLVELDDEESDLKWCEWWLVDGKENEFLVFEVCRSSEDRMISEAFLLMISWEEKSKVFMGPKIFFNELDDRRIKLSNEEPMMYLEAWDTSDTDSFAERETEFFFFLFWRSSMKAFEHEDNVNFNGIQLYEEEGRWLDSVFKAGK